MRGGSIPKACSDPLSLTRGERSNEYVYVYLNMLRARDKASIEDKGSVTHSKRNISQLRVDVTGAEHEGRILSLHRTASCADR